MADRAISKAKFEDWLTPRRALEELHDLGGYDVAVRALNRRVTDRLQKIAAATIIREKGRERSEYSRWPVSYVHWITHPPHVTDDFWSTGQMHFSDEMSMGIKIITKLHGVRFEPKGIQALREASGLLPTATVVVTEDPRPETSVPRQDQPRLPDAWSRAIRGRHVPEPFCIAAAHPRIIS